VHIQRLYAAKPALGQLDVLTERQLGELVVEVGALLDR